MKNGTAVYVGTFDPVTIGHLWVIEQGLKIFDKVIVATGINPDKQCMFSLEDRLDMLRQAVKSLPNVEVGSFNCNSIVTYAQLMHAQFILRGIRNGSDYENERMIRNFHDVLNQDIETLFLMPPRRIAGISSTMVKGLIGCEGWEKIVKDFIPESICEKLQQLHNDRINKQFDIDRKSLSG